MSFEDVKSQFLNGLDKGTNCPCCGRFTKIYKRKLNQGMAATLIRLSKETPGSYIHVKEFLREEKFHNTHDWTLLRYWGLLESHPEKNALWRITPKGIDFAHGRVNVPRKITLLNNEFLGFSNEETTIVEALGDKFDYNELMSE